MAEVYLPFQKVTEFIVILICRSTYVVFKRNGCLVFAPAAQLV